MSVLKQKLDKASQEFQSHQFKEALASYEDCIAFCHRTREAQSLIFNIMTTKAALHQILGELDRAMSTLNEILRSDQNHYLALIRRSQVYKKKGKFNRALKDLSLAAAFCPDNLQVTAMKIEIETMKGKNKNYNSSSEEQSESQDEFDEQMQLNFSNLKKIDRKSCSIMVDPVKARKSRVTISGDTAIEYQSEEVYDKSNNSTSVSKEQNKEKYLRTFTEIENQNDQPAPATNIVSKPNNRSKSILKNKLGNGLVNQLQAKKDDIIEQKYGGRESRFLEKIKDIDGKMISSQRSLASEKEVVFRKSMFASQEKDFIQVNVPKVTENKKPAGRKSCLKRSSFQQIEQEEVKKKPIRKSKFEMMSFNGIDGPVIKNRGSIIHAKEAQGKKSNKDDSDEEGSEHNIFGSKDNLTISKELKEQLGLKDEKKEPKAKGRAGGGKSILKKGSVLIASQDRKERHTTLDVPEQPAVKKAKKSVMFTKSRFAE